jgi:hypothetical protein
MTNNRPIKQIASFVIAMLILMCVVAQFSAALDKAKPQPPLVIGNLKGTWTVTLSGLTGCGASTLQTTFTLDGHGNGLQSAAIEHTAGCGDIDLTGQVAQVQTFQSDGSGFFALGCGSGCGFGFNIQVAKSKLVFNLGPQLVGGNFLAGVAIKK